ncbi:MAG: redoxin domain-containing protein [Akkermansiaceae bacterium]|nr:redoxin domain-containing protein [Akkermansiaceae bacterium]
MRIHTVAYLLCALVASALAESELTPSAPKTQEPNKKEAALDHLLSERDSDSAMAAAVQEARDCGISDQAILEARFLYHVDRNEDDAIATMLPEFKKQAEHFRVEDSAIFSTKEDWSAVTEYVDAIASLKKGDKTGFKKHITEAFWLSPRQASAFAPHIERMRQEEAMSQIHIDFETKLHALTEDQTVALKDLIAGHQAMIIHFWSPANHDCVDSLPDFAVTSKTLSEQGIAMVSLVPNSPATLLTDAKKAIEPLRQKKLGAWLIDASDHSLASQLNVKTLPTFVLISNEGRILFNGEPSNDALWDALKRIDSKIIRPQLHESGE